MPLTRTVLQKKGLPVFARPISEIEGGLHARLTIAAIASAGGMLSLLKHRLYWRFCNLAGHLIAKEGDSCVIGLGPESRMRIFLNDPYWSRLVTASYHYEADFFRVLDALKDQRFGFVDGGANFGYWSILLSGERLGNHPTLAIEASRSTFEILSENCRLNQNRFQCIYHAISDKSGVPVQIDAPKGHAGAHIRECERLDPSSGLVETITLDDAVRQYGSHLPEQLLVKLDVEGQEINAFRGASQLLQRDALFYYEDHGNDPESKVTRFILEELGLLVFYIPESGSLKPIHTTEDACRVKVRKTYGYNFLACRKNNTLLALLENALLQRMPA